MLDYASALWGLSAEDLEARFERLEGFNPIDRLGEALGDRDPEWEHGAARAALADTLQG